MLDFTSMDVHTLATGVTSGGVKYLELFLKEYTSIFKETVNPGCNKCLTSYLDKYKRKMAKSNNTSGFELQPKYIGMPLEFGSQTMVTNENITTEMAKKILARPDGEKYFAKLPDGVKADTVAKPKKSNTGRAAKKADNKPAKKDAAPATTEVKETITDATDGVKADTVAESKE